MANSNAAKASLLVVDDDGAVSMVLTALLVQDGFEAAAVGSGSEALLALAARGFDLVLTDLRMPGMSGMELLAQCRERFPEVPVIVLTAHGTVPLAVEAMRAGAADFILKPFDREAVLYSVRKALAQSARPDSAQLPADGIVGESEALREAFRLIERAAASDATVLIRGESGTGKELAARAVHERSKRRARPFIKVHCAALPDALLESELFGHEKGAFTGAVARHPGRVELADGGTLFLDEIGEITASAQVKLLRLLQDRAYERLGGTQTLAADLRFVAATHRNLEEMVKAGQFREDLYYRLNVVPIVLPPLRERPGDVERLALSFSARFSVANGRGAISLDEAALARLRSERWPGNVRQLQNFIERLILFSDGTVIGAPDIERELARQGHPAPAPVESSANPMTLDSRRRDTDRAAVQDALARSKGNRTVAARLLGVSRRQLYNLLEEHGL